MLLRHAHNIVGVTDSEEDMGLGTTWLPGQDWNASRANVVIRPGIVHRLDKGTTGLLVVAKDPETLASLSAQFKAHTVSWSFLAIRCRLLSISTCILLMALLDFVSFGALSGTYPGHFGRYQAMSSIE